MRTKILVSLLVVLALFAAACGSDGSASDAVSTSNDAIADTTEESPAEDEDSTVVEADATDTDSQTDDDADTLPSGQTIAFSHPAAQAGVVAKVVEFAQDRAAETGNELIVGAFESGTPDEQFTQIENWIAQDVDAIHIFPLDPNSLVPLQERAQEQGITWVTYLLPMEGSDGLLTVPPKLSGEALAEAATRYLEANEIQGSALIFQFQFIPVLAERIDIPATAVETAGFPIVSRQDIIDTGGALTATENTLTSNDDLRVVVAITDDAAVGAARAMENAGIDPATCFIAGADGTLEALRLLQSNDTCYKASAAVDIRVFGRNVVDVPLLAIAGQDAIVEMDPQIVTADDTELLNELLSAFD